MADIRGLVEKDRGLWKKIQAWLPGYKIYRTCEDLRAADNILRQELVKRLERVEAHMKRTRENITGNMEMDLMSSAGELVNLSHVVTEKVRHAEQGYAPWISGDVRIEEEELRALYEYDLSLLKTIEKLVGQAEGMEKASRDRGPNKKDKMNEMRDSMNEFLRVFDDRISKVTKVAQESK